MFHICECSDVKIWAQSAGGEQPQYSTILYTPQQQQK